MTAFTQDLRYGLRMLKNSPAFTAIAVLTLALGIGANTAIFTVVRAALLAGVAIPQPDRVVMVWTENPSRNFHHLPSSVPDYQDWKASGVFAQLGAFREDGFNLRIGERTERVMGLFVTSEMFNAIGIKPWLGRVFREEDVRPGHDSAVLLGYDLWRSSFASDPAVVGKSVVVDGEPRVIIGVLPKQCPKVGQEKIYAPLVFTAAQQRGNRFLGVFGRLRPGISLAAAQQRMSELSTRLSRQYPEDAGVSVLLQPVEEAFVEDIRTLVLVLAGAVGFVLLIACANIANLLLARGAGREKELAIRAALGAGRWTLARQLLTESAVLALAGGGLGILLAAWGVDFIASFKLADMPNSELVTLDATVLAFNLLLSLATGILFGLAPAWQAWKTDVNDTLKAAGRANSSGVHQRVRGAFVISEIALTLVLLAGAGLMLESFVRLRTANPGYNPHGLLTMKVALSERQYPTPEKQAAFVDEALGRIRALPGVTAAAAADDLPAGSDNIHGAGLRRDDRPEPKLSDVPIVLVNSVTPDYFRTMQTPLIRGRYFAGSDRKQAPLVAIVDAWTAKRYWPEADAVGKFLRLGGSLPPRRIVGIVGGVEQGVVVKLVKGQVGQVYVPAAQDPKPALSFAVRTASEPGALAPAVLKMFRQIDVDQPVFDVRDMDAARAVSMGPQRLATALLGGFALVALVLAMIGIYGVVAYNAGRRMREIGIRVALGANRPDVLKLLLGQGLLLTLTGVAIGLAGALALTHLMSSLLFGVRATDPVTFVSVCLLMGGAATLASYIPARRATNVDPVVALRQE